jgi:exopolysaccharide biosynthesis protein
MRNGGSVTYIKVQGEIVDPDTVGKWRKLQRYNGAVLIDQHDFVILDNAKSNQWYNNNERYKDILVTGPVLLENGDKSELIQESFTTTKHPRTCIGMKNKKTIILVTVDGRTENSRGMSLSELTDLMISLKCKTAVNLDGGGSTTLWIKGKPDSEVVNMPCDNRKFDHLGERAVSNVLIIK